MLNTNNSLTLIPGFGEIDLIKIEESEKYILYNSRSKEIEKYKLRDCWLTVLIVQTKKDNSYSFVIYNLMYGVAIFECQSITDLENQLKEYREFYARIKAKSKIKN